MYIISIITHMYTYNHVHDCTCVRVYIHVCVGYKHIHFTNFIDTYDYFTREHKRPNNILILTGSWWFLLINFFVKLSCSGCFCTERTLWTCGRSRCRRRSWRSCWCTWSTWDVRAAPDPCWERRGAAWTRPCSPGTALLRSSPTSCERRPSIGHYKIYRKSCDERIVHVA